MKTWLALMIGFGLATAGIGRAAPTGHDVEACAASKGALEWVISQVPKGPWWLDTNVHPFIPHLPGMEYEWAEPTLEAYRPTAGPSPKMMELFSTSSLSSATGCQSVVTFARDAGVKVGRSPADPPRKKSDRRAFVYTYVDVTKAIVSADGAEAIVYENNASGELAGGASLIFLRRTADGRWNVSATSGLYVS